MGKTGYKRFMRFHTESFSDLRIELTNVFAKEDQVVSLHCYYDLTTLLEHFGLVPATAEPARSERMKRGGEASGL